MFCCPVPELYPSPSPCLSLSSPPAPRSNPHLPLCLPAALPGPNFPNQGQGAPALQLESYLWSCPDPAPPNLPLLAAAAEGIVRAGQGDFWVWRVCSFLVLVVAESTRESGGFFARAGRAYTYHEKMMRAKAKGTFPAAAMKEASPPPTAAAAVKEDEWEVRPGGMLVQKRSPDSDAPAAPVPTIRVKVKFNGVYHEIYINSQASFGELKKMMSARTGLHPEDQKVVYKDKERDSKAFLDMAGVKDRSKMVLLEDPTAQAKRLLEQRRTDKAERAAKSISRISLDVDKLATKVSALETVVGKGGKVVDADVVTLTEALMNELVKLDAIAAEGEVKVQRRMQEKRVQKYVETLDAIRAKNAAAAAAPKANGIGNGHAKAGRAPHLPPRPPPVSQRRQFPPPAAATATAAAPTANWETFDLLSSMPSTSSGTVTTMAAATTTSPIPRFDWELF